MTLLRDRFRTGWDFISVGQIGPSKLTPRGPNPPLFLSSCPPSNPSTYLLALRSRKQRSLGQEIVKVSLRVGLSPAGLSQPLLCPVLTHSSCLKLYINCQLVRNIRTRPSLGRYLGGFYLDSFLAPSKHHILVKEMWWNTVWKTILYL